MKSGHRKHLREKSEEMDMACGLSPSLFILVSPLLCFTLESRHAPVFAECALSMDTEQLPSIKHSPLAAAAVIVVIMT